MPQMKQLDISTLRKALPLILTIVTTLAGAFATHNWTVLASQENVATLGQLLTLIIPALGAVASAGGAAYVAQSNYTIAKSLPPEPDPDAGAQTFRINTSAVDIILTVRPDAAKDLPFMAKIGSVLSHASEAVAAKGAPQQ